MSDRMSEEELAAMEAQAVESRLQAERDVAEADRLSREACALRRRLEALNASNGFAELLFQLVVRGSQ